jgi:hypothetical protein
VNSAAGVGRDITGNADSIRGVTRRVPPLCEGPEAAAVLAAGLVELPVLKARLWFMHKGIEKLFQQ